MYQRTRRIIFILSLSILTIVLVRAVIINDVIKKTIIRVGASIERSEFYQEYLFNCVFERDWTDKECKGIAEQYEESPDNGYNRMIWEKSDYDCSDFDTWELAQNFFQYTHSFNIDWYNLDEDKDGGVCEDLRTEGIKRSLCLSNSKLGAAFYPDLPEFCEKVLEEQEQTKLQFDKLLESNKRLFETNELLREGK